jgi:Raf kinase inhibitor-like YbhB/YbcL family protein
VKLISHDFAQGAVIPEEFAWGRLEAGRTVPAANRSPHLAWSGVPAGTRSFVVACLDDDVPTDRSALDAQGEIPSCQPRRRFVHLVLADCPGSVRELPAGALTEDASRYGHPGLNDYCGGRAPAAGEPGRGYDGPCPPSIDARWHVYRFTVIALDVPSLSLPADFEWADAERAMRGHILATAELLGRYSLNPALCGD